MEMFQKKKSLKEEPMQCWEEESYLIIIPHHSNQNFITGLLDRVKKLKNIKIKETIPIGIADPGSIKLIYEEEEYEINFYVNTFTFPDIYIRKNYYLTEQEITKLKNEKNALIMYMKFGTNAQKSYHLQLKIAKAMVPNLIGIIDESSEKILPPKWVKLITETNILPSPNDLYTIQDIYIEEEHWLHTEGLNRCGITELEILASNQKNYNNHYSLISTYANYLIENKTKEKSTHIGMLNNNQPIVVTSIPWTKGLKEYTNITIGGVEDRKELHNGNTSIIFIYKSKKDEKKKKISKIEEYDELWNENTIFFISKKETLRMKKLAIERFNYIKKEILKKENNILIKIGIPSDNQKDNLEHIWFKLLDIKEEKIKVELIQEPYSNKKIHKGYIEWYKISEITDWLIYTKKFIISPENVYLLTK